MIAKKTCLLSAILGLLVVGSAHTAPWRVDHPLDGVSVLRDDSGSWGGWSMGVAHQNNPDYRVKKIFDLGALPTATRKAAIAARVRVYFGIQDYSWNTPDTKANGLDEKFALVVNGKQQTFTTANPRFAAKGGRSGALTIGWTDFDIPIEEIKKETLEVVIHKLPHPEKTSQDDYIYPGIDNTVTNTHSYMSSDGGNKWGQTQLNTIKAQGEYMIQLVVASRSFKGKLEWIHNELRDPHHFAAYLEEEGDTLRLEPRSGSWDPARDVILRITSDNKQKIKPVWKLIDGKTIPLKAEGNGVYRLGPCRRPTDALLLQPATALEKLQIDFDLPSVKHRETIDLCPKISPPAGKRRKIVATVNKKPNHSLLLDNGAIRAQFMLSPHLSLQSLHLAEIDANILPHPEQTHLFRLKVGDKLYGCRDARVLKIEEHGTGFVARLALDEAKLELDFKAELTGDELELGCTIRNPAEDSVRFYLSFPHFGGIQLSPEPDDDYYLFPWGGGIIASANATLRTAYGENSAWWQMIDLFSPKRGGGLYLYANDPTGLYKLPHFRKGRDVHADYSLEDRGRGFIDPDMYWLDSLEPTAGMSLAFDYLRRDRAKGAEFAAPPVRLGSHRGDWREGMKRYAAWSKKTWPPQPFPSKLTARWTVRPAGWGWQNPLFVDGKYDDSYILPRWDVPELMSWWTWSDKGPWNTPLDRIKEELGEAFYKRYQAYWVKDPVTGKPAYNLNRGDYDGYNPHWGGLPALRRHIQRMKDAGQVPMFYTDPLLACANTKLGKNHGEKYGIMNPRWGKNVYQTPKTPKGYVGSYGGYCMCLDTEWYSKWVAETMGRVCRETGIAGIRLDEYGHRGYVCENPKHKHIFAEPGHNAWLQALARNCRQIRSEMNKVDPKLVLTTEFPGNDHMAAALDGAIVYDIRRVNALRPVPINLFRFFFPECRTFEIDRPHHPNAKSWMLWNATATFGAGAAYSDKVLAALRAHPDVFDSTTIEPLVPTLTPRVYANRFQTPQKTIWTILNGNGNTINGPILPAQPEPGCYYLDLIENKELQPKQGALHFRLRRNECRVIAKLHR